MALLTHMRDRGLALPLAATLAGLVILLALGSWQLQRRAWKEELIATMEARSAVAPLPPEAWSRLRCRPEREVGLEASCDYMTIRLRGTFDHGRERHVFISVPRQSSGIGGPGFWVFTPLRLEGGGAEVYVNRGFVPETHKAPERRAAGQVGGAIEVTGLIRSAEPRGRFSGINDVRANIWYVRAPREFVGPDTTLPDRRQGPDPGDFYIDQTSPAPAGGLPLPLAGTLVLPNRHLEYALTWYGLAATLLAVFAAYARSRW
jgi:surfeit locus 1 family protein